ncbi:MAG: hypothetical protein JWR80_8107 [Bradyrhizobium sp.]|nr:hypothetical protein [Bradyrhizobium sp.]
MSRNRLPPAVAKLTAADTRNPSRYAGRNDPTSPFLGEPSRWLTAAQKRAWNMFKTELPWLVESDRAIVDLAATFRADVMKAKGGVSLNSLQVYSAILSKLAATPVDRSRAPSFEPERERDEFFDD